MWLSPLVVGSMAPDYAYFVFVPQPWHHVGHSLTGLLFFCIPVGLAVLYAFHRFFKRPIVQLMPRPVRARLWPHCGPYSLLPLGRLAWIAVLIFLGGVTHVVWDSFTHDDGWVVVKFPQMRTMLNVFGHRTSVFDSLQYGCSLLGLALVAWWSWQWYRSAKVGWAPADSPFMRRARPWIVAAMIATGAVGGAVGGLIWAYYRPGPFDLTECFMGAFITGVDAFGLALLIYVTVVKAPDWHPSLSARDPAGYRLLRDLRLPADATAAANPSDAEVTASH